jgi:hypothetical protein
MADEVAKQKITVKNTGKAPQVLYGADGKEHIVGPGQEAEVEVAEPQAKTLQEASKAGSGLVVAGSEPEKEERPEGAPEIPEEHWSRVKMAAKEAELMKAGQEGDKERREKEAKKSALKRAAETGIAAHVRGEPETVAAPPDAPPEKDENK